jgi:hypothetical protein
MKVTKIMLLIFFIFDLSGFRLVLGLAADIGLGPIPLFCRSSKIIQTRGLFRWVASLDPKSGKGSAIEQSNIQVLKKDNEHVLALEPGLKNLFYDLVKNYPKFLSDVSLGFLTSAKSNDGTASTIQLNVIGIDLLTFAEVQIKESKSNTYALELPVKGGLLSLPPIQSDGEDRGCLRFECTIQQPSNDVDSSVLHFQSLIQGNYRPWIAGYPTIPRLRKWMYLLSQSLVHAYVMYRFHRLWRRHVQEFLVNRQDKMLG